MHGKTNFLLNEIRENKHRGIHSYALKLNYLEIYIFKVAKGKQHVYILFLFNEFIEIFFVNGQNKKKSKRNEKAQVGQEKPETPSPTTLSQLDISSSMNQLGKLLKYKK